MSFFFSGYIEDNGQVCLYAVPPGTGFRWTNRKSFLTSEVKKKAFCTPSSGANRFHNLDMITSSFEMANCCCQNNKTGSSAFTKTGDRS